jgi:dipeptidyl aminopeptidase/acylaminoacyl peptidase
VKRAPYGSWVSRISAAQLAQSSIALGDLRIVDGVPFWTESRPAEAGRYVIVTPNGKGGIRELTPPSFGSRTRVNEYGGAAYVATSNALYFSNWADQRIHVQHVTGIPSPITPAGFRYADGVAHPSSDTLFYVREDHTGSGEEKTELVALSPSAGNAGTVLFSGTDFVAFPRVSADGRQLAWIAWNHPNMPWDTTTLYVGDLHGMALSNVRAVAGGHNESVLEPSWDIDGTLYFISDRTDWWNLYRWDGKGTSPVTSMHAEFALPVWQLGHSNYALTGDGHAIARFSIGAVDRLGVVDLRDGKVEFLDLPFVSFASVRMLSRTQVLAIAASPFDEDAVVAVDFKAGTHVTLRTDLEPRRATEFISVAEPIAFPTAGGAIAHAFYYPPRNPDFEGMPGEKPPLLVKVHGGPTSVSKAALDVRLQYWTSRGFAVVDVNHRGSAGFGRRYREALYGQWGVVDVEDMVAAVNYLASTGRIDPERTAIRGGSAGGYTTLSALAFTNTFKAGANYYGVSDLKSLAQDTHKFESRYLDRLVAPFKGNETLYAERSPLHHLEGFDAPLITFQGSEDKVVPPAQSRQIVAALRARGVPVEYLEFEGEQHGFRKAENIIRAAEAELAFYGRIFGFTPGG